MNEIDVSKLTIDELIEYVADPQHHTWAVMDRIAELWNELSDKSSENDNVKQIKQLKKQARYSKNPMEVKKLNQDIMILQKEIIKSRKVK